MSFEELRTLVPPPEKPIGAGSPEQWAALERSLGTALPQDYRQLVDSYGTGWFANWICVFSPFSEDFNLLKMKDDILSMYSRAQQDAPEYSPPFPRFPESGGLLPWAQDDNAGVFCWVTSGHPDNWHVVNLDNKYSERYRTFNTNATGFLAGWFSGAITGDWYPEDVFPTQERAFTPGSTPHY